MSIRKRSRRAYQVRVAPFPAQTVPTREAAEKLELDLKLRRVGGAAAPERPTTLGQEIDGYLARQHAAGGLRDRSMEFYEQKAKIWAPLRRVRVSALRRVQVEDFIVARAAKHPRSALDELQFLKRVLRAARDRGQRVDDAVLGIKPVKHSPKRGRALTVEQLYELASWFPEHVSRLILVAGQVGARQAFWFGLTDDMLDLENGTMPIPALVFPTVEGQQWNRARFRGRVWVKSVTAAARNDRVESGRDSSAFDGFNFHWLRHTAGSLMAVAGMDPAVASERMGHTDGGALFLSTYRHLYEGEKRVQAARLEAHVRAGLDKAWTSDSGAEQESLNDADSGSEWAHLGSNQGHLSRVKPGRRSPLAAARRRFGVAERFVA